MDYDAVPEVIENQVGSSLLERLSSTREINDLGPPELVTIISSNLVQDRAKIVSVWNHEAAGSLEDFVYDLRTALKDNAESSFLHLAGNDTGNIKAILTFLTQLAGKMEKEYGNWFTRQKNKYVICSTMSIWNIFRECDVCIISSTDLDTKILIVGRDVNQQDLRSLESKEQDLILAECFVSSFVRVVMALKENLEDGELQNLVEMVIVDIMEMSDGQSLVDKFIELFPLVYLKGYKMGSSFLSNEPTRYNNMLVDTLVELVRLTRKNSKCLAMLEELSVQYSDSKSVMIRILLNSDSEVDAIRLINTELGEFDEEHDNIKYKSFLLCLQVTFLLQKEDTNILQAKVLASNAVECALDEFVPWYLLSRCLVLSGELEEALVCLSSCPITTAPPFKLRAHMNKSAQKKVSLPLPVDVILEGVTTLNPNEVQAEYRALDNTRLKSMVSTMNPRASLIYSLLVDLKYKFGQEQLLATKEDIFIADGEKSEYMDSQNRRASVKWFDGIFVSLFNDMILFNDLRVLNGDFETLSRYTALELELYGVCAKRLKEYDIARSLFEMALKNRFSSKSAKRLLEILTDKYKTLRLLLRTQNTDNTIHNDSNDHDYNVSEMTRISSQILDLCVRLCCWNHRWYINFSIQILDAVSLILEDWGISRVSAELHSRYSSSVYTLVQKRLIHFFKNQLETSQVEL